MAAENIIILSLLPSNGSWGKARLTPIRLSVQKKRLYTLTLLFPKAEKKTAATLLIQFPSFAFATPQTPLIG